MNGQRKPRQPRWPAHCNTIATATLRATLLTQPEIDVILEPITEAHKALREGVATEENWDNASSAINVALAIQSQRVVRCAGDHLQLADQALAAIKQRARSGGTWKATQLDFEELDVLKDAFLIHDYQLRQLSAGEFHRAVRLAIGRINSAGGRVIHLNPNSNGAHHANANV